jgi:hypothetical protein
MAMRAVRMERRPISHKQSDDYSLGQLVSIRSLMSTPLSFQLLFGIFASMVVAGAWCYIAVRLPFHWITYALALVATAGAFLSLGIVVLAQSHQSLILVSSLAFLRTGLGVLNALLYVAFAAWITSGTKTNS